VLSSGAPINKADTQVRPCNRQIQCPLAAHLGVRRPMDRGKTETSSGGGSGCLHLVETGVDSTASIAAAKKGCDSLIS
jgi:hypothetical protein